MADFGLYPGEKGFDQYTRSAGSQTGDLSVKVLPGFQEVLEPVWALPTGPPDVLEDIPQVEVQPKALDHVKAVDPGPAWEGVVVPTSTMTGFMRKVTSRAISH